MKWLDKQPGMHCMEYKYLRWFLIVAIGTGILSFTMFSTWMISGER